MKRDKRTQNFSYNAFRIAEAGETNLQVYKV